MRHILKDGCITNKFPAKPDTIPDGINCRRPGKHEAQGICPGCKKKERSGVRYGRREKKDMDLPPDSRHRGDSDRSDLLLQRAGMHMFQNIYDHEFIADQIFTFAC